MRNTVVEWKWWQGVEEVLTKMTRQQDTANARVSSGLSKFYYPYTTDTYYAYVDPVHHNKAFSQR
jgi:hypothetical protein